MRPDIERVKLYIRLKLITVVTITVTTLLEFFLLRFGLIPALAVWLVSILAGLMGLIVQSAIRQKRLSFSLLHFSLITDLLVIAVGVYYSGGPGCTWAFLPVILIFIIGYILDLRAAFLYSCAAFLTVLVSFGLEYYRLIPHQTTFGITSEFWRNPFYLIDYLLSAFVLFFTTAFIAGNFSRVISQSSQKLEAGLQGSETARRELEASRKALLSIMEDLDAAKGELEKKVRERTAQLEEAKDSLEGRVKERTADLEESRKAIMHMMRDLKEDIEKLSVVDRLKTEFLSMVSHELRTPLTPIKGYLSLLLAGKMGKLSEEQKKALDILQKQADHLHSMIDNILDIARLEVGKPIPTYKTPVSMETIINETADAMQIQAQEKQIKIPIDIKGPLPTIMGDENKLKRIMTNLIGNAIKFTPQGGEVRVRSFSQGQEIRTEVIDNGIGLARENLEKIFEKFYQVDASSTRTFGGIGMGLPIAKELVELHSGKLWAESDGLGKGSRFIFTLPVS